MTKTKFISIEGKQKESRKTVFTKCLDASHGWEKTIHKPTDFGKVVYLGKCDVDGDMFAAYDDNFVIIFKGVKGSEFD